MSHHFVVSILLFLRKGATIVIGHRTFPASVVEAAAAGGITFIYASPVHYALLAGAEDIPVDSLRNVRIAISTAMKLPAATAEAFVARFGFELTEAYGIIEVGLPFINLNAGDRSRGSVGKMLPAYELRLDNPDTLGIGEVLIRGKGMFDAYFSPWQLPEDCLEDGWFRTGDLGRLDDEGNLEIVGRRKTVIIFAGLKVFPTEVEEVLNAHPGVSESLVSGAEHATYGQIPEARIVPAAPGMREDDLIPALRRHCYERLAAFKVPKAFKLADSLPRTASGKLIRR
jgi:long-chain acyl-CoA synthetase